VKHEAPGRGRVIRRVASGAFVVLCVIGVIGGWFWWRLAAAPSWWAEAGRLPANAAERAEALERGVTRVLHEPRSARETGSVSLTEGDANAWFAERLAKWVANRGETWAVSRDREFTPPRVRFDPGRITLGVPISEGWTTRIVSLSFEPRIASDGGGREGLLLAECGVSVGRVDLDASGVGLLLKRLAARLGEDAARLDLQGMLRGRTPIAPAEWTLEDGRRVRVTAIRVEQGRLIADLTHR
jgi:hypothetical protein